MITLLAFLFGLQAGASIGLGLFITPYFEKHARKLFILQVVLAVLALLCGFLLVLKLKQ